MRLLAGRRCAGAVGTVGLAVLVGAAGCASETQVIGSGDEDSEELTCKGFVPGTNMLDDAWATSDEAAAAAAALLQHAGDMRVAAQVLTRELAEACDLMAEAGGATPAPLDDEPTADQLRAACALAAEELAELMTETGVRLTAGPGPGCNLEAAAAQCRSTCTGEETCDPYCASSAAATADCPPAIVTAQGEVTDESLSEVAAMASALGVFLGAAERGVLISDLMVDFSGVTDSEALGTIPRFCIPIVIEALEASIVDVEAAVSASASIQTLLDA